LLCELHIRGSKPFRSVVFAVVARLRPPDLAHQEPCSEEQDKAEDGKAEVFHGKVSHHGRHYRQSTCTGGRGLRREGQVGSGGRRDSGFFS
jgi:hypothetical protein